MLSIRPAGGAVGLLTKGKECIGDDQHTWIAELAEYALRYVSS